jgi:hypothetical protein
MQFSSTMARIPDVPGQRQRKLPVGFVPPSRFCNQHQPSYSAALLPECLDERGFGKERGETTVMPAAPAVAGDGAGRHLIE